MKKSFLLENIRSLQNVGAIFRTADGAGFDTVYLTGITGMPPRKEISKTALGAENHVAWEYYENPSVLLSDLKAQGVKIVVLEQDARSIDFRDFTPQDNESYCIVVGNEIDGVSADTITLADIVLEIPMLGMKKSLNVATAGGILAYQFARRG